MKIILQRLFCSLLTPKKTTFPNNHPVYTQSDLQNLTITLRSIFKGELIT